MLVPTQNLVDQQGRFIEQYTNLRVQFEFQKTLGKYSGSYQALYWTNQLHNADVMIFTMKKLYDIMVHGFLKMEDFDLIIFDECHHASQGHHYNLIMQDFYFFHKKDPEAKLPKVLGLTASPIKQKVGDAIQSNISLELHQKLQELANNLHSKFYCITDDSLNAMEQTDVNIQDYPFDFEEKAESINYIAQNFIMKIFSILKIDANSFQIHQTVQGSEKPSAKLQIAEKLLAFAEKSTLSIYEEDQDKQLADFSRERAQMIGLDLQNIKTSVHLNMFKDNDSKILLLFSIIILAHANTLILELGNYSFMEFLKQQRKAVLEDIMKKGSKLQKQSLEIVDGFKFDREVPQFSQKIGRLVAILNGKLLQFEKDLKVIVFVKNRIIAEFLQKLFDEHLNQQTRLQKKGMKPRQDLLDPTFKVAMAIGQQSKNLLNRAYKSVMRNNQYSGGKDDFNFNESFLSDDAASDFKDIMNQASVDIDATFETDGSSLSDLRKNKTGISSLGSTQSSKMTNKQLRSILANFKSGHVNLLIATSVVEEGLDVSQCNLVVCMNELMNVKKFVQMKGRARQAKSEFIFLCSTNEKNEVVSEKQTYDHIIKETKKLAKGLSIFDNPITPQEEVIQTKIRQARNDEYCLVPSTGAKLRGQESVDLIANFCKAVSSTNEGEAAVIELGNGMINGRKISQFVQNKEPFYHSTESATQIDNQRYFTTYLYLPKACKPFTGNKFRVEPQNGYTSKKDSLNHVAIEAVKLIHSKGHLDDFLVSKIGVKTTNDQTMLATQQQQKQAQIASSQKVKMAPGRVISKAETRGQITELEKNEYLDEQQKFMQEMKRQKSKHFAMVEDSFKSNIREPWKIEKNKPLFIHCLKGAQEQASEFNGNGFPFKSTRDYLGILFNRNIEQKNPIKFWMFQEQKQKDKNQQYLEMLRDRNFLSEELFQKWSQEKQEMVELEMSRDGAIELNIPQLEEKEPFAFEKLRFFHSWIFYYFFCADHLFLEHILQKAFSFSETLFDSPNKSAARQAVPSIFEILGNGSDGSARCPQAREAVSAIYDICGNLNSPSFHPRNELHPYVVPLVEVNEGGSPKMMLNFGLINHVIRYIESKIFRMLYSTDWKSEELEAVDLQPASTPARHNDPSKGPVEVTEFGSRSAVNGIWDDLFSGVRYVKLEGFSNHERWRAPVLHLDQRGGGKQDEGYVKVIEQNKSHSAFSIRIQKLEEIYAEKLKTQKKKDIYTVQQYNYDKYACFLMPSLNRQLFIVRKERHFVDFSKIPKAIESDKIQAKKDKLQKLQLTATDTSQQVSTRFDIPQQLIRKSPLSYDQYQVFQLSCTHLLFFNEFLQVEKFIKDKFQNVKCFLKPRQQKQPEIGYEVSTEIRLSQMKENLQSDMEPSSLSRNVFLNPNSESSLAQIKDKHGAIVGAREQLLNNVDLVMEALTAPNANRHYDYERLEFYGDSVISFLVILELFLTKEYNYKEGPLDFYRIKQVSNMNFFKINLGNEFYKYIINEPQTIFNDFVPATFDERSFQTQIKHKSINELYNKLRELKRQFHFENKLFDKLCSRARLEVNEQSFIDSLRKFLEFDDPKSVQQTSFSDDDFFTRSTTASRAQSDQEILEKHLGNLDAKIKNLSQQVKKKMEDIKLSKKTKENKKMFFFKQLADVVESVTGASAVACGLNAVQVFLKGINVLKFDQEDLAGSLERLKKAKENHADSIQNVRALYFDKSMDQVEDTLQYKFKNKLWLVEALTHKSHYDNTRQPVVDLQAGLRDTIGLDEKEFLKTLDPFDDYERLEFLGDAILNFLVAEHFYKTTVNDAEKKMPKELHKMKTSVINNALLSLIVIENELHNYVLFNTKAISFKEQYNKYVERVQEMLKEQGATTEKRALDLDQLYEYNLKIFGDVFESLLGAIFIDSKSLDKTAEVLFRLITPYIDVYANLDSLQDHSRTKLLELWNQKSYMRNFKCSHLSRKLTTGEAQAVSVSTEDYTILQGLIDDQVILQIAYQKDAKNKLRQFYKHFFQLMSEIFQAIEKNDQEPFLTSFQVLQKVKTMAQNNIKSQVQSMVEKSQLEASQVTEQQSLFGAGISEISMDMSASIMTAEEQLFINLNKL